MLGDEPDNRVGILLPEPLSRRTPVTMSLLPELGSLDGDTGSLEEEEVLVDRPGMRLGVVPDLVSLL